jgi:hypothetical protein
MVFSGGFDCALRCWSIDTGDKMTDIDVRKQTNQA